MTGATGTLAARPAVSRPLGALRPARSVPRSIRTEETPPGPMANSSNLLATINLVLGGLVFLLGLVILRENPQQRLNRVVSLLLFFGGFGAVLSALALLLPTRAHSNITENAALLWELFFPTAFLLAVVFPEERAFTRLIRLPGPLRDRSLLALVFGPHVFHFLLVILVGDGRTAPALLAQAPTVVQPILAVGGLFGRLFLSIHRSLFSLVDLAFGAAAIALLVGSWRATRVQRLRRQLGAIAIGLTLCLALYASATSVPTLLGRPLSDSLRTLLTTGALLVGSGAIAYAMVRHKFLDTKLIARRGILYAVASAVLIGLYLMVVQRINAWVAHAFGIEARIVEPVFLIMALTLFQPAIGRLEELLDQMFLRDPGDYRNVLRQLGRDLQTTIDLDDLLNRSVRTVADTLMLRAAHVVALTPEGPVSRSGAGAPLESEALRRLELLASRLPANEASFRLSEPIDGLKRLDRELLEKDLRIELMLPLRWRGEAVGLLLLGEKLTATEYTSEDVQLLIALGGQMAVSLQNSLLLRDRLRVARLEEELSLAQQIQRTFLRAEFPPLPRCEVHAVNLPSRQVGGDYYDVVPLADGSFFVAIADVAGKGVPAALMSSMLQAGLRTQARAGGCVSEILRNINALIYRSTAVHQFATFFLAHVDASGRRMSFANAGHNYPVLVRTTGERRYLERGGLLLGIMEDIGMEEDSIDLQDGDVIVFYTDGISEATNAHGELFGDERVGDLAAAAPAELGAEGLATQVLAEVESFLDGVEAQDDRTLVVLRVREGAGAGVRAID